MKSRDRRLTVLSETVLLLALAFVLICAGPSALAEEKSQQKKSQSGGSKDGVAASVSTDGALVYAAPDFDAQVIGQLPEGQQVRISKGTTPDGQFHKIRVGSRIGYIAHIDVATGLSPAKKAEVKKKADKRAKKKAREREEDRLPIYFSRFVGLVVGQSEFKEGINGVGASANLLFYGLKVTGPDLILSGPILDWNLMLHYGAPSYYESLSAVKPSGFILLTDLLLVLPISQGQNNMGYVEAGPMMALSKFSVFNSNRSMDLTSLNLGVSLAAGFATRIEKVALRFEGKYTIEKQQYKALFVSLQTQF